MSLQGTNGAGIRRRVRLGFTLVELLVVIGIIALLISILLPSLSRAREQANQIKCLSNIRQMGMAFVLYANDFKGNLPPRNASRGIGHKQWDWIYWQLPSNLANGETVNDSNVLRYMSSNKSIDLQALRCPSDVNAEARPLNGNNAAQGPYTYSYTVNVYVMTNNGYPKPPPNQMGTTEFDRSLNLARVRDSTRKFLLVEEDERTINDGVWVGQKYNRTNPNPPSTVPADYLAIRHDTKRRLPDDASNWVKNLGRRGNAAFLDGHAEYVTRSQAHDQRNLIPERD